MAQQGAEQQSGEESSSQQSSEAACRGQGKRPIGQQRLSGQGMQREEDAPEQRTGEEKTDNTTSDQEKTEAGSIIPKEKIAKIKRKKSQIQKEEAEQRKAILKKEYEKEKVFEKRTERAIYTDGGYRAGDEEKGETEAAGWGYIVIEPGMDMTHEKAITVTQGSGQVCTNPQLPQFAEAKILSNNTAELTAMYEAFRWLNTMKDGIKTTMYYDSMYTANAVQNLDRATQNTKLIIETRKALAKARKAGTVRFEHVKGHCGHRWNEAVDKLATEAMSPEGTITILD